MIFKAHTTSDGAFIPVYLSCDEFTLLTYKYFLLDTGSAITALSAKDLGEGVDYSAYEKKREEAIGVWGYLKCFLIHNIRLFLLPESQNWTEIKKFNEIPLLPPSVDQETGERLFLPSIIGRDIIGSILDLAYSRKGVYLEN